MPDKTSRLCTDPHSRLVSNSVLSARLANTEGCYPCIPAHGRQCPAPPACSLTAAISHLMLHTIQTFQRKTFPGKTNGCKNRRYNHPCSPGTIYYTLTATQSSIKAKSSTTEITWASLRCIGDRYLWRPAPKDIPLVPAHMGCQRKKPTETSRILIKGCSG